MSQNPNFFTDPASLPVRFYSKLPPPIFGFGESSFPVSFSFYGSPRPAVFLGAAAIQLGAYLTDKDAYSGGEVVQLAVGESPSIELLASGNDVSTAKFSLKTSTTDGFAVIVPESGLMEMRQPSFSAAVGYSFSSSHSVRSFGPVMKGGDPYYPTATMTLTAHRFLSSGYVDLPTATTAENGSTVFVIAPASSFGFADVEVGVRLTWYEDENRLIPAHNPPLISMPGFGLRVYVSSADKLTSGVIVSGNSCTITSLYPTTILNELGGDYVRLAYWGAGADRNGIFWGDVLDVTVSNNGLAIQGGSETASYVLANELADYDNSSSSSSSSSSLNSSSSSSSLLGTSLSSSSSSNSSRSSSSSSISSRSSGSSDSSSSSSSSSISSLSSLPESSSSSSSALLDLSSSSSSVARSVSLVMHFTFNVAPDNFGVVVDDSGNGNDMTLGQASGGLGPPKWDYGYGIDGGGYMFVADSTHTNLLQSTKMGWLTPRGTVAMWVKGGLSGNKVGVPFCVSNGFVAGKTEFAVSTDALAGKVSAWVMVDGVTKWSASTASGTYLSGSWTQVAVTHDGREPAIYVNGTALPLTFSQANDKTAWMTALLSADSPATKFFVGGAPRYYSPYMALGFSGQFDELTVWDQALSGVTIEDYFSEMGSLSSQSFSSMSTGTSSSSSSSSVSSASS